MTEIGYYLSCKENVENKQITIQDFFDIIKSDKLKKHTDYLRNEPDKKKRAEYKTKHLPAVTIAGTFEKRAKDKLLRASGLAALDIDDYSIDINSLKNSLAIENNILAVFASPSGGLKIIVKIPIVKNDEEYKIVYHQLLTHFKKYNPKQDESSKDICRLCFLSYDPEIDVYINPEEFQVDWNKKVEEKIEIDDSSIPKYCPFIEEVACKQELPSGALTRHSYLDGNVWQYCNKNNKPQILEQYKKVQGRNDSAFNNCEKWKWGCETILKYCKENKKEFVDICKRCKSMMNIGNLPTISLKDMLANGIPEMKWRVKSLIPQRGVVIFGGTSSSYKTWTAMHLALCCASGEKFLGHFDTEKCKVLYIDEENGDITIPNRFNMLIKGGELKYSWETLDISIFNNIKLDTINCPNFNALIDKTQPDVVFVDSLVRCMEGEEDKVKDVRQIFDNLKYILEEHPNIAFIILHHTTKGNSRQLEALRGSGDFAAFADVVLMFSGTKEGFANVTIAKNRHIDLRKLSAFSIDIESVEDESIKLSYAPDKSGKVNYVLYCIADLNDWFYNENIDAFMSKDATKEMGKLGHKRNAVYAALAELVKKGDISKLRRGQYKVINPQIKVEEEDVV